MRPVPRFLPLIVILALVACASSKKPPEDAQPAAKPRSELVGRVASIPSGQRFVLIQRYGSRQFQPGTIVTTRGENNQSANLLITGEALGSFVAADIQSGDLQVGDPVYIHDLTRSEAQKQPEITPQSIENQSTTENLPPP